MRILLVLAMMGWGLVWTLSKMLLEYGTPAQIASFRYLLVFLCFVPLMLLWKISFRIPQVVLIPTLITGFLNVLYSYLMYAGMRYGDAGSAGVITEVLSPIMAAFLWSVYRRESLTKSAKIGLMLGLLGGAFLVDVFENWRSIFSAFYSIYVLAALDWAALMISSRLATEKIDAIALNFHTSVMTFILLSPALFLDSGDSSGAFIINIWGQDLEFFLLIGIASVFCTVFATTIFYKALFVLGVVEGGIYALLAPVFALGFAFIILGEVPKWHTIIGGILAVGSIYIINVLGKKH